MNETEEQGGGIYRRRTNSANSNREDHKAWDLTGSSLDESYNTYINRLSRSTTSNHMNFLPTFGKAVDADESRRAWSVTPKLMDRMKPYQVADNKHLSPDRNTVRAA